MRCVLRALLLIGLSSPALADDFDVLRGSQSVGPATFTRWSGFYFGGHASFNYGQSDFSGATQPLAALALQGTEVEAEFAPSQIQALGIGSSSGFGAGGFLGYNTQWEDVVVGVEASYTRASLSMTSPSLPPVTRSFSTPVGNVTSVTIENAAGHLSLTDYVEARGRAGYVVGNLLPYAFLGFAAARTNFNTSVEVDAQCGNGVECAGFPLFPGAGQSNALLYGFAAGGGVDWALAPNFFLRGEVEVIQFAPFSNISLTIVDARIGGGFKF